MFGSYSTAMDIIRDLLEDSRLDFKTLCVVLQKLELAWELEEEIYSKALMGEIKEQ